MTRTYHAQSDAPCPTMTVGQLIERLQTFGLSELVIFRSPHFGSFGPNTAYAIETVERVILDRSEHYIPACERTDDETGKCSRGRSSTTRPT